MLRLFRSNQPLLFILIPIIGLSIWFNSLFHPVPNPIMTGTGMPFFDLVLKLTGTTGWVPVLTALLLNLLSAILAVRLNRKYIFLQERTLLPLLFFLVLSATLPQLRTLHPLHCALPFILLAFDRIFATYRVDKLSYNPFETSLLTGIATFLYGPAILFLPMTWIGLLLFRQGSWREWFFSVAGFCMPFIFYAAWLMISNQPQAAFWNRAVQSLINPASLELTRIHWIFLAFLLFLILLSSHVMIRKFQSKKIFSRRIFTFFFWMFIILILGYFLLPSTGLELLIALAIPCSYLYAHFFIHVRKSWWGEALLWILTAMVSYLVIYS